MCANSTALTIFFRSMQNMHTVEIEYQLHIATVVRGYPPMNTKSDVDFADFTLAVTDPAMPS
jgi:hypothetical protein